MLSLRTSLKARAWPPGPHAVRRGCTALLALAFVAGSARAQEAVFHPDLERAATRLDQAQGPEAYAAVRRLWALWDRADPTQIEELLLSTEQRADLAPAQRTYAAVLGAFARARRGDLKTTSLRLQRLGYVDQWLMVGPFDNEGKVGLDTEYGPEQEFASAVVPGKAFTGKERPVRWRATPQAFPFGWVDASALVRPETKICLYATTFVSDKSASPKSRKISAWVGTGGAFKLFWNGKFVLKDAAYRGHDFDRSATELELSPGPNNLTLKVCGDEASPAFSLRLADASGAPDDTLVASNDLALSAAAAQKTVPAKAAEEKPADAKGAAQPKKPPAASGPEGPVQTLERKAGAKAAKPTDLEAYARYLVETDGDDPAEHKARDLARRAAEAEPTVERYLLAGRLAEDRNKQDEWLNKAEALVSTKKQPNRDVLLARAIHRRTSPNWREASVYFDQILNVWPDDVTAIAGRVELYNLAGLPRTALAILEGALARNPRSVNLLNMYGSQLRTLGRATDAAEVESRYAMLRFDDGGYLSGMIDLSLARRDRSSTERWIERLLHSYNGSSWALGVAARSYRSLGQPERAIAMYKRALELAPEDTDSLRAMSELEGDLGRRDQQLATLREILRVRPQDRGVREYLEHLEPQKPRPDEAYAWASDRFLKLRHAPAMGQNRRTLRDLTVSTVFDNGLSSQFRQIVFQPLTEPAAAAGRQYAFAYESGRQVVQLRGARVYRGDGRVDEAIEYGEGPADDPSIAMYTSARTFYIQFPRLEPGDVVELRYRIDDVTPRNEFGDYFGEITYLQSAEHVSNAEYVLITPKNRTFYIDKTIQNLQQSTGVVGNQRVYRFLAKELAGVPPEPSMPPWQAVLGFVHVSTYKSWQDLGRWYWGLVKDQFDLDDETRKLAKKIAEGKTTDVEKVKAVNAWVINNTRYVALEFGIYGYKPRRCVQTVARGWGDCKDKATVIVTLLKELGIPATIVVVRTRMRGDFQSKVASFAPFDHAIAYVPSLNLYLDGTAEHTGIAELPRMDVGSLVLHVNEGKSEIRYIPNADPQKNFQRRDVRAQLAPSGEAKLEIDYATEGYNAAVWRDAYHAEATRRERINRDLGSEFPGFEIAAGTQGIQTGDLNNVEEAVRIKVRGSAPGFARREGNQLSMPVTVNFRLTPTYASLSQRRHDVELIAFTTLEDSYSLKLPAGAKVVSLPQAARGESQFGSYSVQVENGRGEVSVKSRVEVKVARIKPSEYAAWKRFCEEVDRAMGARLVIEP
jgi:tetratricopeptide (TPR) repeat protein